MARTLHSRWYAYLDGVRVDASTVTFASRTHPSIVAQETTVHVDRECRLRLVANMSLDGVPGSWRWRRTSAVEEPSTRSIDGWLRYELPGGLCACGMALHSELVGAERAERAVPEWVGRGDVAAEWSLDAVPGRQYALRQLVSLVSTVSHHQAELQAARPVGAAADHGFTALRQRNHEEWTQLWKGRPVLV
jgi:hypothetical protein